MGEFFRFFQSLARLFQTSGLRRMFYRTAYLGLFTFVASCSSYYQDQDGPPAGQVIGDFGKCADPQNQGLPACYCHGLSLLQYPERAESCQPLASTASYEEINYQADNCENPLVDLESLKSLAERKDAFCSLRGNRDLSSCYCHSSVVNEYPERRRFCRDVESGDLPDHLSPYPVRSMEWIHALRQHTNPVENSISEAYENWSDNTRAYLNHMAIEDDCDAVDSLLDLAFAVGGFELFELSKVLVDTNLEDDIVADHYVGAIWVSGSWYYIEEGSEEVRPLEVLEFEGIYDPQQFVSRPVKIIAYRKLDQSEWYQGRPPSLNSLESFCPVPANLLISRILPWKPEALCCQSGFVIAIFTD